MKPSVLVFDLGKVLVDFDYLIAAHRIAPLCPVSPDPAKFFNQHADLLINYELGKLSTRQFFDQVKAASGFSGTQAEFNSFFADIFAYPADDRSTRRVEKNKTSCLYFFQHQRSSGRTYPQPIPVLQRFRRLCPLIRARFDEAVGQTV